MTMTTHTQTPFGRLPDKSIAHLYTFKDKQGFGFSLTDYGAALVSLFVPDRHGRPADVLLGFDSAGGYAAHDGYAGAVCGRVANRIRHASFELNGIRFKLKANDGPNHLHGGKIGFDKKHWRIEPVDNGYRAWLVSEHMDEGYPGRLHADVAYRWLDGSVLDITYTITADSDTVCCLTNHAYFNLNGPQHDARDQYLTVLADTFTERAADGIPSGRVLPVGGVFDIRNETRIRDLLLSADPSVQSARGIDHNFAVRRNWEKQDGLAKAAVLYGEASGIDMTVSTTLPGLQVYTGNYIDGWLGKQGVIYGQHSGIALETQYFPNAVNEPSFLAPLVPAQSTRTDVTRLSFTSRR